MATPRRPKPRIIADPDDVLERRRVLEAEASGAGAIVEKHIARSHRYAVIVFDPHPAGGVAFGTNMGDGQQALDVARLMIKLVAVEGEREAS